MERFTVASAGTDAPAIGRALPAAVDAATGPGRRLLAPFEAPDDDDHDHIDRRGLWFAVVAVAAAALAVLVVSTVAYTRFPLAMKLRPTPQALAPGMRWLQSFSWWDGAWYVGISKQGYGFMAGRQSPVAFFPGFPLLIRFLTPLGGPVLAGFLVSLASGIAASLLFYAWAVERVGRKVARVALAALLLYPCSFYLFGVLYADSVFLLAAVAAFVFVERDRPVLAGLAGAVATATRPIGMALAVGLWLRALERRKGEATWPQAMRSLRPRDAGLLLAPAGFVGYAAYLGFRFGDPFLFSEAERGWGQAPGPQTWLKVSWWHEMRRTPYLNPPHYHLVGALLATVLALALVVVVFRRLGWGYGFYSLGVVLGSAISTKNFIGMGRYTVAAFPVFAAAGLLLKDRTAARWLVLAGSGALLLLLTELHARNMLIS